MIVAIPINDQTWLICGGRGFSDQEMFDAVMSDLVGAWGMPAAIVHGVGGKADAMAGAYAHRYALTEHRCPADWEKHGRAAGPIRNQEMLDRHKPKVVVAFPGGKGTADMLARSRKAGICTVEIKTP